MSHILGVMSHRLLDESCHTYQWVTSHIKMSTATHKMCMCCMSLFTFYVGLFHVNFTVPYTLHCPIYTPLSHIHSTVPYTLQSPTYTSLSHTKLSHLELSTVRHTHESCHTYIMSHITRTKCHTPLDITPLYLDSLFERDTAKPTPPPPPPPPRSHTHTRALPLHSILVRLA